MKGLTVRQYAVMSISSYPKFERTLDIFRLGGVPLLLSYLTNGEGLIKTFQGFQFKHEREGTYYLFKSRHFEIQITVG